MRFPRPEHPKSMTGDPGEGASSSFTPLCATKNEIPTLKSGLSLQFRLTAPGNADTFCLAKAQATKYQNSFNLAKPWQDEGENKNRSYHQGQLDETRRSRWVSSSLEKLPPKSAYRGGSVEDTLYRLYWIVRENGECSIHYTWRRHQPAALVIPIPQATRDSGSPPV